MHNDSAGDPRLFLPEEQKEVPPATAASHCGYLHSLFCPLYHGRHRASGLQQYYKAYLILKSCPPFLGVEYFFYVLLMFVFETKVYG